MPKLSRWEWLTFPSTSLQGHKEERMMRSRGIQLAGINVAAELAVEDQDPSEQATVEPDAQTCNSRLF